MITRSWLGALLAMSKTLVSSTVTGPASSTAGALAKFADTTGALLSQLTGTGLVKITANVASVLGFPADATKYLDGTGAFTVPAGTGINQLTGDVTAGPGSGSQAATIAAHAVLSSKFRQSVALSVVGNGTNATADVADLAAASDGQVLRRSGTAVAFGAVNLASANAVTGILPAANGGYLIQTVTTFTDAQIKLWPTTLTQILAAAGSGIWNKLIAATLVTRFSAGAYTNINATNATLQLQSAAGDWVVAPIVKDTVNSVADLTNLFTAANKVVPLLIPLTFPSATGGWQIYASPLTPLANLDNQAIQWTMDNGGTGNLTGGNALNTAKLTTYSIVETL